MKGYLCDGCGAFDPGTSDQRDGSVPPKGWFLLVNANATEAARHLCAACGNAALNDGPKYQEMRA